MKVIGARPCGSSTLAWPGALAVLGIALVGASCTTQPPNPSALEDGGSYEIDGAPSDDSDAAAGQDANVVPDAQSEADGGALGERDAGSAEANDAGSDAAPVVTSPSDAALRALIEANQLTGDPAAARGALQVRPADDALVRLGQVLFFSQTLAGGFDSACGTCHQPDFGGSDGLSLAVGVAPLDRSVVGPGRRVEHARDLDPQADGGPNMHRNSLSMFNAALHDRGLLMDSRVFVLNDAIVHGGRGQAIRTPEDGNYAEDSVGSSLLEVMTKFPTVNDNEMRGFLYTELTSPVDYRERLVRRLRGEVDTQYMTEGSAARWLALFRAGFDKPSGSSAELITMLNVQRALAAYVSSQIFVDTPWRRYVQGELEALDDDAKAGARLFLADAEDGGLGCVSCHAGDRFTDESFVNVGFPQIGRGFRRADRRDPGRWAVERRPENWYAFRVPGLLNVARTAPYGHAGTFATLEELLRYHTNPRQAVEEFDFSLQHLAQFRDLGISYEYARAYTDDVIENPTFAAAESRLPRRALSDREVEQLIAFLNALTDACADDAACRNQWTPDASLDPDGNMVVLFGQGTPAPVVDASSARDYPDSIPLAFPALPALAGFADTSNCPNGLSSAENTGSLQFINHTGDATFGLTAPHGFSLDTWFEGGMYADLEAAMIAGGVTATYLDDDCWPDLVFAGGDKGGLRFYRSRGHQQGYEELQGALGAALRMELGTSYTGVAAADLNGDYRRELVLSNLITTHVPILSPSAPGTLVRVASLPMPRHTFGISFAQRSASDPPSMFLAHWSPRGVNGATPALFDNAGGQALVPVDDEANTSFGHIDQSLNFTPKFADFRAIGVQDLLISSDLNTSHVLQDQGDGSYQRVTDRNVLVDENGMGGAILDFDNDGLLDWFVTSVFDPTPKPAGSWGKIGNRLYRNVSTSSRLGFQDATERAGVADGSWGWGACAADFNHDGFADIFHVNGFGYIPADVVPPDQQATKTYYDASTQQFQGKPSRLFINQKNGTFKERAAAWGLDVPSEGRGVSCFDYDRDGDIDIVLVDHSKGLQFFENQVGHALGKRFLSVRVVGAAPNTEALGARVSVTAIVGLQQQLVTTQTRVAQANSNYLSQDLPDLHFGMGYAPIAMTITVRWPNDPTPLVCHAVATNQFLVFDQREKRCPTASGSAAAPR